MMRRSARKSVFGGAAIVAVALVASSGGYLLATADADQGSPEPLIPLEHHDPVVRKALLDLFSGSATRYAAQEELVRRCMAGRGFTYVKNPVPTVDVAPTLGQDPYGLTPEQARRTGYNSAENAGDSPGEVDRSGVSKLSAEQQKQWGEAYFGPEDAPEVTVDLPGGGTAGTTSEGCLAEAKKRLYGSLSDYATLNSLAGNLPIWARREAASSPDMARIDSTWSACMTSRGYPNLKNPSAARERSVDVYQRLGVVTGEARDQEISLAVADAECDRATDYTAQRVRIEDRHYGKTLKKYAAEVTAIKEMNASALARAQEALRAQ
ncbi:hypothetical protein [Streptosporangium saharense]|uniref:hypothetical protein n=1 Tax=Streptosporangium saharense TaxID=1706840 RepID=UPI0033237C26